MGIALLLVVLLACDTGTGKQNGIPVENKVEQHPGDVVFGAENAPHTVFMYASYFCDYCRYFFSRTLPPLQEHYLDRGEVKLVVKWVDFTENPQVLFSLQAASCIAQYGIYEKFHPLLMVNPDVVFTEDFLTLIDDIMNDNSEIAACIQDNNNYAYLRSNVKAFRANRFSGTPTFVINGKMYSGFIAYENFEKLIEKEFNL